MRTFVQFHADEFRAVCVRLLAYLSALALVALVATEAFRAPVVAAVEPMMARETWIVVPKPHPAFEMTLAGGQEEPHYAIARHAGGGRKDTIVFGEPGRSLRSMAVEIYRPGDELARFSDPVSEIASHTRGLGMAGGVKPTLPIETKFGMLTAVDFLASTGGHCIGFARAFEAPRLQISGFACSMDSLVSREGIACTLDRLTLISAGNDSQVAALFARAELNRTFCGQRDVILAATPKRPMPSQSEPPVKLRGRLSAN